MVEYMGIARPSVDDSFLDEIRRAAVKSSDTLNRLLNLSATTKRELLSDDVSAARRAASEVFLAYFQSK